LPRHSSCSRRGSPRPASCSGCGRIVGAMFERIELSFMLYVLMEVVLPRYYNNKQKERG
jgi:hypothetical protein